MQDENEFVTQNSVAALALWNPDAIASWSLLFTPVFGSYFVMKNWQSIGDTEKARTAQNWLFIRSHLKNSLINFTDGET